MDLNSARASSRLPGKIDFGFIPVTFSTKILPPSFSIGVIFFSLFFFFCLWTLRLLKSYPSLLPQLGTFSGNVSSSFMVFSCIVKVRKLLLPFIPAPFSDFIIQADCCDRSASSFIFYHVRLRFVLLFPFLSSLFIFGFPSSTR